MPVILLRCVGWNRPAGTTGGPWLPLSVDLSISIDCHTMLIIVLKTECSNDAMFGNRGSTVYRVEWHLQTVLRWFASPEDVAFRAHMTQQQKICLVWKPFIVEDKISSTCLSSSKSKIVHSIDIKFFNGLKHSMLIM